MDYSFHIQNFSNIAYNKVIKPNHEATFAYSFMPAEQFAGRPFGLNINLAYKDAVRLQKINKLSFIILTVLFLLEWHFLLSSHFQ